jgi:hypothetical protein
LDENSTTSASVDSWRAERQLDLAVSKFDPGNVLVMAQVALALLLMVAAGFSHLAAANAPPAQKTGHTPRWL